jgi:hypothetical protein
MEPSASWQTAEIARLSDDVNAPVESWHMGQDRGMHCASFSAERRWYVSVRVADAAALSHMQVFVLDEL